MDSNEKENWFSQQVIRYEDSIYRVAYGIVQNNEDAKDIIQESLFRAYMHYADLKNPEKFKPWILRITTNCAYDFIRKRSDSVYIHDDFDIEDPNAKIDVESDHGQLWEIIQSLPKDYREILILFYYEDFNTLKISQVTGLSIINVKTRLSRARKKLKQILTNLEDLNE